MTPGRYLGIDVGGTNTKCVALTSPDGAEPRVVDLGSVPTAADTGPGGVRDQVIGLIRRHHQETGPFDGVGLTMPGTVNTGAGTTGVIPNIAGDWDGFAMAGPVADAVGLGVWLINDARAFALAEATVGAARGLTTVVCLTLGTGVGGGVVVGGRLHGGHTGMAGEIGHQTVDLSPRALRCGCGNLGCLETLTQAAALCRRAGQPDVQAVFQAAAAGEARAVEALRVEVEYLAIGMANAYLLLCPDAFVIGGGIALAGEALRQPLLAAVRRRMTLDAPEAIEIRFAELGPAAGAIGAALWSQARSTAD